MDLGAQVAGALLGRPVELVKDDATWFLIDQASGWHLIDLAGELHLVNPETGEVGNQVGPERAARYASLLMRAAMPENHIVGIMDGAQDGLYEGGAAAWKSSLRLDPNWAETLRRRSRKLAKKAFKAMRRSLPAGEQNMRKYPMHNGKMNPNRLTEKLLTLTQPRHPGAKTLDQIQVFNRAFSLLRKLDLWKDTVWGGVKGIEDHLTPSGPDVHGHLLILSRFVDRNLWRAAWWACLNRASREAYGEGLELMPGGLPFLDVRMVRSKGPGRSSVETDMDSALDEVTKYVTKTSDLLVPDKEGRMVTAETLLELCDIGRWPRMFELLGQCHRCPQGNGTLLDTSCISDADELRDLLTQALEPEEIKNPGRKPYFRTEGGDRSEIKWTWNYGKGVREAKEKARPPSWRELMSQLPMADWLHMMMGRAERGYLFRIRWLADHNPTLFLMDLAGNCVIKQSPDMEFV